MSRVMSRFKIVASHPLIILVVFAVGFSICGALGLNPHYREALIAAGINLVAAELAMIPVFIIRNKPADNVVQGALVSTIVHMGIAAGGAMAVLQWSHPPQAFLYWLCAFYWTTLAGVCRILMKLIKSAPVPTFQSPVSLRQASET